MKAAMGELNMTVIVVLAVGILSAFFFLVIWPMVSNNFEQTANCKKAVCNCTIRDAANQCKCAATKSDLNDESNIFYCPFGG